MANNDEISDHPDVNILIQKLGEKHVQAIEKDYFSIKDRIYQQYPPVENRYVAFNAFLQNNICYKDMKNAELIKELNALIQERPNLTHATIGNDTTVAMIYELLTLIFEATTSDERSYNFHTLSETYYNILKKKLEEVYIDNLDTFKQVVNKLLPFVKLNTISRFSLENRNKKETRELLIELLEYLNNKHFLREDCYTVFQCIRSTHDKYDRFEKYEVEPVKKISGYVGDYYKLRLYLQNKDQGKTFHIFVKFIPRNVPAFFQQAAKLTFKKEAFVYSILVPKFEEYDLGSISNFAPRCWTVIKDTCLLMEDLHIRNYVNCSLGLTTDVDWLRLVLKNMAKIHSCSLILEEKWSKATGKTVRLNEEYGEYLQENMFTKAVDSGKPLQCGTRLFAAYFVDKFPDVVRKVTVEQFKKYLKDTYTRLCSKFAPSDKYRNTICHGDLWQSNILCRSDESSKPVNCLFVDYQLLRYCPPVHDISLFIYLVTNRETRAKLLSFAIEEYYNELSKNLSSHGIDIEGIYDRDTFMKCFEELRVCGVWQACCYGQVIFLPDPSILPTDPEEMNKFWTEDASRIPIYDQAINDPQYFNRMREFVQDIYDLSEDDILDNVS